MRWCTAYGGTCTKLRMREAGTAEAAITWCMRRRVMDETGQQCAEQFYRSCTRCGGLIQQDEAVVRDGWLWGGLVLGAPISEDDAAALSEDALAALMAEFTRLHAEAKQLN